MPSKPYPAAPTAGATAPVKAYPVATASPVAAAGGKVIFKIVPGESKVTYEVGETFLNQNNRFATAIGVTTVVNGEIMADKANPPASTLGPITVDISQFKSDNNTRDNAIRNRFLESSKFPIAKFTSTKIEGLPAKYEDGKEYSLKITGDALVREVTLPVTFNLTVKLTGDTLTGKGTTEFNMSQFKFGPISIAGVLNTEDKVKLTIEFVAKP
jgi:polyisoprenoid-binding protein YceI